MNVLAITKAGPGAPSVWLEAGIHAREWIAPAVATFIVRELVNSNCRLNLDKLKVQFYNILQFYFIYNFILFYLQFYFIYNFLEALFLMFDQVEDYAEHPDYLDKINWYFLPSANPDG